MGADWLSTDLWRAHVSWLSPPWVDDTPQRRADFDAERWMRQLESAHFRAFIFYVKHHDGWTAYPSALAPVQPERDYLAEAVAAARRHGMKYMFYYSSVFDQIVGHEHRDWLVLARDGQPAKGWYDGNYPGGTYCCINNPGFRAFLLGQVTELRDRYDPDAMWLDVFEPATQENCFCPHCRERHAAETGGDLLATEGMDWYAECHGALMAEVAALVKTGRPDRAVTYNSGQRLASVDRNVDFLSHEAWDVRGTDLMCRALRSHGKPFEATYRAYTAVWSWTMRGPDRLLVESMTTLAHGGACSPELPPTPSGAIRDDGVAGLAEVGAYVRVREKYLVGAEPIYDAALFETDRGYGSVRPPGWADVMLERDLPFAIVYADADLSPYRLVVLDDRVECDEVMARKLAAFVRDGGALIVEAAAARFGTAVGDVLAEVLGVACEGEVGQPVQYVSALGVDIPIEGPAWRVRTTTARALAYHTYEYAERSPVSPPWCYLPPAAEPSGDPAVTVSDVGKGRAMYIAAPLTSVELRNHREGGDTRERPAQLAAELARYMIGEPLLEGTTPAGVELVVNRLGARHVVHLLNRYVAEGKLDSRAGLMRLARVPVSINERRVGEVRRALLVGDEGEVEVPIARRGEWAEVVVNEMGPHEMLVLEH